MTFVDHEVVEAFRCEGLSLHKTLVEMLNEDATHRTERRGCGYTQATRFLATFVNQIRQPIATDDLTLFAHWPAAATQSIAAKMVSIGWGRGWRALDELSSDLADRVPRLPATEALLALMPRVRRVRQRVDHVESLLLLDLIEQILAGSAPSGPDMPGMPVKPEIGSCSQAEEFFLEIAHGRVRRHGHVNSIVDDVGRTVMLEKMNLGESHSALVIEPVRINGVLVPAGGLCALRYDDDLSIGRASRHGKAIPITAISEARFLRLTTLSVSPEHRRRAFSAQVDAQIHGQMVSPMTTTLDDLRRFARNELVAAK